MPSDSAPLGSDESIDIAAAKLRHETFMEARRLDRHPWWTTFANGRIYRPAMKVMHRLGLCYPQPSFPDGDVLWWCHWCGLRGKR